MDPIATHILERFLRTEGIALKKAIVSGGGKKW